MDTKVNWIRNIRILLKIYGMVMFRNNNYQNSQMVIVTGPNIDLAIKLIKKNETIV